MAYSVALTGSIASGKTTAAHIFAKLGAGVVQADKIAKELTAKYQPAYEQIVAHYGSEILNKDAALNRFKLRNILFTQPEERDWMEQLLHPLIRQKIKDRLNLSTTPYLIIEIPLLVTKENYPYLNRILLINAPIEQQLSRIIQRDNCSRSEAEAVLAAQPNLDLRLKHADDLIINDRGIIELTKAIKNLDQQYRQVCH